MTNQSAVSEKRNLPLLTCKNTIAQSAWMMVSPSIVLTFLAVAVGMPVFLVGILVTIRQIAMSLADIFLFDAITRIRNRRRALALADISIAGCFVFMILTVLYGSTLQTMVVFVVGVFLMAVVDEFQQVLMMDFIGDNLKSRSRLTLKYVQMALGGVITMTFTWLAHEFTLELPPMQRHSIIVAIGISCFTISACTMLAIEDFSGNSARELGPIRSPAKALSAYFFDAITMLRRAWFRKFMILRVAFVSVLLSIPFFSLISAEAHHTTKAGLTALVISSAAGYIVAGTVLGPLNNISHRLVMFASALLVSLSGLLLAALHIFHIEHDIWINSAALFAVTVAARGVTEALGLYFIDIAPKDQRVQGYMVSRSLFRVTMICVSAMLAAVAHLNETVLAIVFITVASFAAAIVSLFVVRGRQDEHVAENAGA